jgi:uncharacterized membrane protein
MGPLWWIWMLIWVAALLFTVWLLVRAPSRPPAEDALAILRARFARGEINQTEYETARDALVRDAKELHR